MALSRDDTATSMGRDDTGHSVYYLATPFYDDTTRRQAGVVAIAGDALRGAPAHHRLIAALLAGCAALTAAGAATGHLLSRRSMRPAWQAYEQHERLLGDAAHELRTPVTVIRGAVDLLDHCPNALPEHLLSDVVDNLLTRSRLQAGAHTPRLGPLRLDQLIETVCAELPAGGHQVSLDLQEAVVTADAALVRTAVRNLLDNAVRHGTTTPGQDNADITVTVRGAEVSVADRGPGIPCADVPAVFARYHSLRASTGIGLSLVQWVADTHHGSIGVRPRPAGGSVFTLRLAPGHTRWWGRTPGRLGHRMGIDDPFRLGRHVVQHAADHDDLQGHAHRVRRGRPPARRNHH
ncbi:sensor histidine kinase [Streptomyces sp. NPDC052396]|uniref:sensor histidine kinase n=1 Tax=Streptomyces sp. NPDC052396 TaxID=3365689 RepID=UPI0037D3FB32